MLAKPKMVVEGCNEVTKTMNFKKKEKRKKKEIEKTDQTVSVNCICSTYFIRKDICKPLVKNLG